MDFIFLTEILLILPWRHNEEDLLIQNMDYLGMY